MALHPPPGRAGRRWLTERLAATRRAADLLERKEAALRREHRHLAELADRTGAAWERCCHDADTWAARALVLGSDDPARAPRPSGPAHARLEWHTQMGVTTPGAARCDRPPPVTTTGSSALSFAAAACGGALDAAVEHAAATTALRRVDAELLATRGRLRAIRDRWIPKLDSMLSRLEVALDEAEREEIVRLRWASGSAPRSARRRPGP